MQAANIAPVDLAQASLGPGIAIFSRYENVLEQDGKKMSIRKALKLINQELDTYLSGVDSDLDAAARFAADWFEQYGFDAGPFGQADVLARAKNISVSDLEKQQFLDAKGGDVTLTHWRDLEIDIHNDYREKSVWIVTHILINALNNGGENELAKIIAKIPPRIHPEIKNLLYKLFSICEKKGWAKNALDYNALLISWEKAHELAVRRINKYEQDQLL